MLAVDVFSPHTECWGAVHTMNLVWNAPETIVVKRHRSQCIEYIDDDLLLDVQNPCLYTVTVIWFHFIAVPSIKEEGIFKMLKFSLCIMQLIFIHK